MTAKITTTSFMAQEKVTSAHGIGMYVLDALERTGACLVQATPDRFGYVDIRLVTEVQDDC